MNELKPREAHLFWPRQPRYLKTCYEWKSVHTILLTTIWTIMIESNTLFWRPYDKVHQRLMSLHKITQCRYVTNEQTQTHFTRGWTPVVEQIDFKWFPLPQRPVVSSVFFRTVLMSTAYTASASSITDQAAAVWKTIAFFFGRKRELNFFPCRVIWYQKPFLFIDFGVSANQPDLSIMNVDVVVCYSVSWSCLKLVARRTEHFRVFWRSFSGSELPQKKRCFNTQEFTGFLSSQRRVTRSNVSFQTK